MLQACLATIVHEYVDGGDQDNRLSIRSRVESVSDTPDASAVSGSVVATHQHGNFKRFFFFLLVVLQFHVVKYSFMCSLPMMVSRLMVLIPTCVLTFCSLK